MFDYLKPVAPFFGGDMTNEEILANAPDKATHVAITDNAIVYIKSAMVYDHLFDYAWRNGEWVRHQVEDCRKAGYEISSLSDIRRIVELEKEVERLNAHSLISDAASALNDDLKQKLEAAERVRDYHEKTIEVFRDWFTALRDHHVSNFESPTAKAFIGNTEVHIYWYSISELLNGNGELDATLNKFAIEQKIEELDQFLQFLKWNYTWSHAVYSFFNERINQLRQQLNGGE